MNTVPWAPVLPPKVVAEDLTFFPNIEFLDVGENQVEMGSLANLTGLQELHLHCGGARAPARQGLPRNAQADLSVVDPLVG